MMRYLITFLGCLFILSCSNSDNAEPPTELVDFEESIKINKLWSASTGNGVGQQYIKLFPLIVDEKIIVADRDGNVTAFDINSGDELWRVELNMILSGGVGGDENHLLVTSRDGHVIMLDGEGKLLWQIDATSEVLMPAQISAGVVVIRSVDGRLSALDIANGAEKWTYKRDVPALSLRGNSTPIITKGYVFSGLDSGRLVALDLLSGNAVFDIPIATPSGRSELERLIDIDGNAVVIGDTLYIASYQGRVVSLNIRRGQLNWSRKTSTYSGVEYAVSNLYLADDKDHLWAYDASNGATMWKQEKLAARNITRPVAMKNTILVADFEGYIHWLSQFDGRFLARVDTDGSGVLVPPVVHNDVVYVLTRDGELSAYTIQ